MNKELMTYWPCSCRTWREEEVFYIKPCSMNCKILLISLDEAEKRGNRIVFK